MNKHQYALNNIGSTYFSMNYVANEKLRLEFEKMYNEYKQTLQELVDKSTPKKHLNNSWIIFCPKCKHLPVMENGKGHNYCPNCGQLLDWSKDEN